MMMDNSHKYQQLNYMGLELMLTEPQKLACNKFVTDMYGGNSRHTLHQLRCLKAKGSVKPRNLPPTENSLSLHLLRCVVQLWIWRHATTPQHLCPSLSELDMTMTHMGFE